MKKLLLLSILLTTTLLFSLGKTAPKTGCILAQQGDINVSLNNAKFDNVTYKSVAKEGKNFKEILVGSIISAKNKSDSLTAKITDIKANKRVKREPRTGTITMAITLNDETKEIPFNYKYDKEIMNIKDKELNFTIKIKAILCSAVK